MKKEYRIKKREEFTSIINQKQSCGSKYFVIYASEKAQEHTRVGISVPTKMGDAVDRNKIKRQMRMMIMDVLDFDNCASDFIVICKKSYLENSFEDNKNDLEKLFKKVIIKKYE